MVELILYVKNQSVSRDFYATVLQQLPMLDVPGMTEFSLGENCKLGLMPETGIIKILGDTVPDPSSGNGIPRCEVYLKVVNAGAFLHRAIDAGATPVSPMEERNWGDLAGYCADLDGHILAFAELRR